MGLKITIDGLTFKEAVAAIRGEGAEVVQFEIPASPEGCVRDSGVALIRNRGYDVGSIMKSPHDNFGKCTVVIETGWFDKPDLLEALNRVVEHHV